MDTPTSTASEAVGAWRQVLGDQAVIAYAGELSVYTQSTCGSRRQVAAVLKPASHEEVERVIAVANTHRIPLYPISGGKQWGMGSRLPVRDGAAIVDLSRMNRIIEVNSRFHYAVVEPGVTQKQLLDYIRDHNLPLMLNVTGSTSDTSLIGNAMDRGVGYFDSRAHGISNMQVVLGSGRTIQTGFGHFKDARTANLYPYGIGPSLDALFQQANYGIVTSACIDLLPRPDGHLAAIIKIDTEDKLPQLVDALRQLRARGIFTTVAHVGNRERSYMTLAPLLYDQLLAAGEPAGETTRQRAVRMLEQAGFGPWSAAIGILGTVRHLKTAKKEIRRAVRPFARALFLNDRLIAAAKRTATALSFIPAVRTQQMLLRAVEPVYGFTRGDATDLSLKSVYWAAGDYGSLDKPDPDHSGSGILFCLPILPASGEAVMHAVRETDAICSRYGFRAAVTVNLMNAKSMEGVISISFDRGNPAQEAGALECIQRLETRFIEQGYPPYRVGINSMDAVIDENDTYWQTVRDLKQALDPNGIIAPGRYNID